MQLEPSGEVWQDPTVMEGGRGPARLIRGTGGPTASRGKGGRVVDGVVKRTFDETRGGTRVTADDEGEDRGFARRHIARREDILTLS